MGNFVHLHVHSEYSLLDGSARIEELVKKAKNMGMNALALTDHGNMYGIIQFYKACKENDIKPVLGCEVYVTDKSLYDKSQKNRNYYHLILLAENNIGYQNLIKIVSIGNVDGFYYKPRVDKEVLKKYSEGIIASSACLSGEVNRYLLNGDYEEAKKTALEYQDIFGRGNFFLEMQDHGMPEQKKVNELVMKLKDDLGIDVIATNDSHYLNKEDYIAHDVLLCIQTGKTVNDDVRMKFPSAEFYLKSEEEMRNLFSFCSEAIENTQKIADRCNVEIEFHKTKLPHFDIPEGYTNEEYLKELVESGLKKRYENLTDEIIKRYEFEFDTIKNMGYVDYFLIVWDFVRFAKMKNIPVGPGRGSAAGSIVAYALEITGLDPLKYDLLFERFLNPERVSMPDIDIDFDYERREEVIEYVNEKYGENHVAQIVTFGTMAAKMAIRDVGRALDVPYGKCDSIAKMVPGALNMTLKKALEISKELKRAYDEDLEVKKIIDISIAVEGLPRHTSTHAAGVLITGSDVTDYVPLTRNDDTICTQFNMIELEELGLLKMDFLGLRTLTVIDDTIKEVKKTKNVDIDIDNLDLTNQEVIELFKNAETIGIFQFESAGMRRFLKDLKADRFEDLIAANSLFRPGPMDQIPKYIESKHDESKIKYIHPSLKSILEPTYGCIVYQEQVMQIVRKIGGYSLGRADLVRRAMSKKKMSVMEKERQVFIYGEKDENGKILIPGAVRNGVDEKSANEIYDLMITFANYAFNKSHSVSYAYVAFQTAYLKKYYPAEFMAALISSVVESTSKVVLYLEECKRLNIEILRPDVNSSFKKFSVEKDAIRFGLLGIKGLGENVINSIVTARESGGKFKSLKDFITRVSDVRANTLNKRAVEALIRSGSLDSIIPGRAKAVSVYEEVLQSHSEEQKRNVKGQFDIFGDLVEDKNIDVEYPDIPEFSKKELYEMEKDSTGVYITGHPLEEYEDIINKINKYSIDELKSKEETESSIFYDGKPVEVAGMIVDVKKLMTKKNDLMAFVYLEDLFDTIECVVFPKTFDRYTGELKENNVVKVGGKLQVSDAEDTKLIVEKITPVENNANMYNKLFLRFNSKDDKDKLNNVINILNYYKGNTDVIFYFSRENITTANKNIKIDVDKINEISDSLKDYLSNEDIVLK